MRACEMLLIIIREENDGKRKAQITWREHTNRVNERDMCLVPDINLALSLFEFHNNQSKKERKNPNGKKELGWLDFDVISLSLLFA